MAGVVSNDAFFADVRRLFELLDLDGDELVDHSEATLGLSHCFEAVHHIQSPRSDDSPRTAAPPVSAAHKAQAVASQVSWLFSATHHATGAAGAAPTPLPLADFTECYHRLLQSGYEPEVLHVDLSRAIAALQSSQQWRAMAALLRAARRLFALKLSSADAAAQRSTIQAAFKGVLSDGGGGSWGFASSKRRDAARVVAERLQGRAGQLSEAEWLQGWKDIVQTEFEYATAARDVDAAAGVTTEAVNGH